MKISESTAISMPMKNLIGIIIAVSAGIFAFTEITARLTSLETSRELFESDLLKKSTQLPTDQEQYMLLEHLAGEVERVQQEIEENRHTAVNLNRAMKDIEKMQSTIEILKDKIRANGGHQ